MSRNKDRLSDVQLVKQASRCRFGRAPFDYGRNFLAPGYLAAGGWFFGKLPAAIGPPVVDATLKGFRVQHGATLARVVRKLDPTFALGASAHLKVDPQSFGLVCEG